MSDRSKFFQKMIFVIGLSFGVSETLADDAPQARRVRRTAEEILSSPEFQNFERLQRSTGGAGRQSIGSGSGTTRFRMRTGSGGNRAESQGDAQNPNGRQRLPGPGRNPANEFGGDGQPGDKPNDNRARNQPFDGDNQAGREPDGPGNNPGENPGRDDFPEVDNNIPNPGDRNFGEDGQPGDNADNNRPGNNGNPEDGDAENRPGENIGENVGANGELNNDAENPNGNPAGAGNDPNNRNQNGGENGANNANGNNPNPPRNNEPLPPVRQNNPPDENPPPREQPVERSEPDEDSTVTSPAANSFAGFIAGLFHLLAYAILGIVIGLILWLIIKAIKDFELPTKLEREELPDGDLPSNANEPENAPGEHPPDVYIAKARELAAIGNYRDAIAQLAMGAMSRIERTNRIRYRRGLTIRDYLRALRQYKTEYQAFRSIVRVFEPVSFGRREPTRAQFEQSLGGYEAVLKGEG